jgi:hypothetical protein
MQTMSRRLRWPALVLVPVFAATALGFAGCSGCNRVPTGGGEDKRTKITIDQVKEDYRRANDVASARDANGRLNEYLAEHPDELAKFPPAVDRGFLESAVGLSKGEIEEADRGTFTALDNRHLEGCLLLREAAQAMKLPEKLPPLDQAAFCFRWVTRQVVLDESSTDLLPPQFVLRRGSGSAAERAFVFLSLIKQLNLDGCVLTLPDRGPVRPWLVGVLIEGKGQSDVYLFDPRLGLPLPGPDGKGIATLAQLRKEPKLLAAFQAPAAGLTYDVEPDQVASGEIRVLLPLSALSARMRYLDKEITANFDPPLHVADGPKELLARFEALKAGPVRVWNAPPTRGEDAPASPTRSLRQFLPRDEGGTDATLPKKRLDTFNDQLLPTASIVQGLSRMQLSFKELPPDAVIQLVRLASGLWNNFVVAPQWEMVRGRLDEHTRRVEYMIRKLETHDELNSDEVEGWRKSVVEAYKAGKVGNLWVADDWLTAVLATPDAEITDPKPKQPRMLGKIVLKSLYDPMHGRLQYLMALRWHEKAARLQVQLEQIPGANKDWRGFKEAIATWETAENNWQSFVQTDPAAASALKELAADVKAHTEAKQTPLAVELLAEHAARIRLAAQGHLLAATAAEADRGDPAKVEGAKRVAAAQLKKLVNWSGELGKNADLTDLRGGWAAGLPGEQKARAEKVLADLLDAQGSLAWMRHTADLRLARLAAKPK